MKHIRFFGNTDMGRIRTNNEDAFISQYIWDEKHILAVAIDGVGGYEGGEIASAMARDEIVKYLEDYSNGERLDLLKQAVIYANNAIYRARKETPTYSSMSCVLTAALIEVDTMRINMAHVGDTRLYQFADDKITKLSHDHSLVGYREEIGELTEEEAMRHPQRNVIGRDVGSTLLEDGNNKYVEAASFPLEPKSSLLLCSDGLCDMITSSQMAEILRESMSVEEKVNAMIEVANNAGGKDNVTVVIVETDLVEKEEEAMVEEVENHVPESSESAEPEEVTVQPAEVVTEKEACNHKHLYICILSLLLTFLAGFFLGHYFGDKVIPAKPTADTVMTSSPADSSATVPVDSTAVATPDITSEP